MATEHQIIISPSLRISAEEFAAAWNADPECRAVAELRPAPVEPNRMFGENLTETLTIITAIGTFFGAVSPLLVPFAERLAEKWFGDKQKAALLPINGEDGSEASLLTLCEDEYR